MLRCNTMTWLSAGTCRRPRAGLVCTDDEHTKRHLQDKTAYGFQRTSSRMTAPVFEAPEVLKRLKKLKMASKE